MHGGSDGTVTDSESHWVGLVIACHHRTSRVRELWAVVTVRALHTRHIAVDVLNIRRASDFASNGPAIGQPSKTFSFGQ
jgi:hypothetical protein